MLFINSGLASSFFILLIADLKLSIYGLVKFRSQYSKQSENYVRSHCTIIIPYHKLISD